MALYDGTAGERLSGIIDKASGASRRKRWFDIAFSVLGLALLAPLLLLVASAIRIEGQGPVLFRQWREGRNGRPFQIYKFRTMGTGSIPEPTPLGRWLRKTSIDELPQLFNVLRGEMSLVGPRPHVPNMVVLGVPYRDLVGGYDGRLQVLPGVTGLAQAHGLRGAITSRDAARDRIAADLAYIERWSWALDLRIIALTLWRELTCGTGS